MVRKEKMIILYIGGLFKGSTGLERKKALEELGHKVLTFDADPYVRFRGRWEMSITHRLKWGPAVWKLNRDIVKFADRIDYELAWVSKGTCIYPQTVQKLKAGGKAKVLHYSPDSHITINRSRHLLKSIPVYDACITTKKWELPGYKELGGKRVVYAHKSVNLDLFKPHILTTKEKKKLSSDVCFIGRFEDEYCEKVYTAYQTGADVAVWGQWQRHLNRHAWLEKVFRGPGIWHENYVKAICATKIGLGLLSKKMPERVTQRSFEIPACGTFMLAERTEEHLSYFEEGKEAEFFGSNEELADKIKYYLKHDLERKKIAQAGRERCLASGYDNINCIKRCLELALDE